MRGVGVVMFILACYTDCVGTEISFRRYSMKVDLHIHSTYSDSSRSPEEIVALAKKRNVGLLSICDHATIGAYSVLPEICRDNGMKYVLGVELEILWKGESLHMLAYNFDPDDAEMRVYG